jgi:hypothetical protein
VMAHVMRVVAGMVLFHSEVAVGLKSHSQGCFMGGLLLQVARSPITL